MRKFTTTVFLCSLIWGLQAQISSYPYMQDFEGGQAGWSSGGTSSTWAFGTPNKTNISGASSGSNAWVTGGLTGLYNNNENSYVESPFFNFSSLTLPFVEVDVFWNAEFSWDGANLQASTDSGATWQLIGNFGDPDNWYTDNTINGNPGGSQEGWSGRAASSNGSGGWVLAKHDLFSLAGEPDVLFRIYFGSDGSVQDEGFAFDDFHIYQPPPYDLQVLGLTAPSLPACSFTSTETVTIQFRNGGSAAVNYSDIQVAFQIVGPPNTGPVVNTLTQTGQIPPGDTVTYTFTSTANMSSVTNYLAYIGVNFTTTSGITDSIPGNNLDTLLLQPGLSGTYTINSNNPSGANNYQSFSDAVTALETYGVCGPVVFNVVSGTGPYNEKVNIGPIQGTSSTNTITFNGGASKERVTYAGVGSADWATFRLDGAQHIILKNLTIENTGGTYAMGVRLINMADSNMIDSCVVMLDTFATSTLQACISAASPTSSTGTGFPSAQNITISNNRLVGGGMGIALSYQSSTIHGVNNQILNNQIYKAGTYGMWLYYQDNLTIQGNEIRLNNTGGTHYGMYMIDDDIFSIVGNKIIDYGYVGIYMSSPNFGSGAPARVINNMISGQYQFTSTFNGSVYLVGSAENINFWHNSFSVHGGGGTAQRNMKITAGTTSSGIDIRNNSFAVYTSGTAVDVTNPSIISNLDYNNYFTVDTSSVVILGSTNITPGTITGAGTNSHFGDPVYLDNKFDLHTKWPQLDDRGDNNVGVGIDIDGDTRPASGSTIVDIGADEFTPPQNDAGIIRLLQPTLPICPGSTNVSVTIRNDGLDTLNTVSVNWSINGTAQTGVNLTNLGLLTGDTLAVSLGTVNIAGNQTYDVIIYTANPNGSPDEDNANDTLKFLGLRTGLATGTYTIDSGSPTSMNNYQSFADAVSDLNTFGVCGPVVFNVVAGSGPYNESVTLTEVQGTSLTNTITFNGGATQETVYVNTSNPAFRGVFNLVGADYITIKNLTLVNYDSTTGAGVLLRDQANNNTIDSCVIIVDTTQRSTSFGLSGIVASAPTSATSSISSNESANNLTVTNNVVRGGTYGIILYYLNTSTYGSGNVVRFNRFEDVYYYGVYSYYQDAPLITNNEILYRPYMPPMSTFGYGIYMAYAEAPKIIANNIVGSRYMGMYFFNANWGGGTPTARAQVINNMVCGESPNSTMYGIYLTSNNANFDIFHNSVALTNGNARALYVASSAITGLDIRNNAFTNFNTSSGNAVYLVSASNASQFNYNCFYNNGYNDLIYIAGTTYDSSNFRGASGFNAASFAADPGFNDIYSDLHAGKSGVLWDRGNNAAGVADDIDGDTRPGFSTFVVDVGADEFEPPAIQGTFVGFTEPSSGCGLTDSTVVGVRFRNSGVDTIYSVNFTYVLNSGTPVTETYNDTIIPNQSIIYQFTATANMQAIQTYNLDGWIVVTGDTCTFDDSLLNYDVVNVPTISSYPYLEDFETGNGGWTTEGNASSEWELGMPAGNVIDTAASGVNSWMTDLDNLYENGACGYVISPCFDFSNLGLPEVSLAVWWNSEFSWDGAVLQATTDNGLTWVNVGAVGDPNNWYNDNSVYGLGQFGCANSANEDGWAGRVVTSNGSGGWVRAVHEVPSLAGEPGVRFRVYFGSDGSVQDDGFAFDDFAIRDLPPVDVGATKLISPSFGDCGDSSAVVEVSIENFGSQAQTNIPVTVRIDTNGVQMALLTTTYTDTLAVKGVDTVAVGTINTYAGGAYDFTMYTAQVGDADAANDTAFADSVVVNEIPGAPMVIGGNQQVLCIPDSILLQVVVDSGFAYNWYATDTGTTPFAEDTFQIMTPFLTADTSYWLEAVNGGGGSCVRITEAELGGPDYIEITNSGTAPVDVTGWTIAIGEDGASSINTVATTTKTLTGTLTPGQIIWYDDNFSSGANYWGSNILWNPTQEGWILLIDAQGQVVDYMVWQWSAADVQNFNPTVAGYSIDITGEWTGGGFTAPSYTNVYRVGNTDNNDASDFLSSTTGAFAGKGQLNPNLVIPFTACGGTGCISPRVRVDIIVSPPVPVDLGPDVVTCGTVMLNPGPGYASYLWNTGDTTQVLDVTVTGTYSVQVTNQDGCRGYDTVNVITNPNPPVDLGPDSTVCGAYLLDAGNPGATWTWQDGSNSQTYLATTSGLYYVEVVNQSTGCSTRDSVNLVINAIPPVDLGADRTECDQAVLDAGNTGLPTLWSTGATSQTITVTTSGQYSVEVTDPATGCVGMDTVNLGIAPSPAVDLGADTTICDGDVLLLDAGNPGSTYAWSSGATAQTEVVSMAGTYSVVVTDVNNCEGADTIQVDVAPPAVADFNVQQVASTYTFNFSNLSSGSGTLNYLWDFGDNNTSTQENPSHTYSAEGNYIVCLEVSDDCGTEEYCDTITVSLTNAIDDGLLAGAIKLFPNPTDGKVFVSISDLDADVEVAITDMTGRTIATRSIMRFEQDQAIEFDLTEEAEGVYLVRFEAEGRRLLRKVVLER